MLFVLISCDFNRYNVVFASMLFYLYVLFYFKQKTAYEMRSSDWSSDVCSSDLTVNPEYLRYELHRVWVLEGTLKEGVRHICSKRRLYIDEDSWLALMADNYDSRGQLWRVPLITYHY